MTYLVTGATGKAGRHVVSTLLAAGKRVRALTRNPSESALPPEVEVVRGDLTDPDTVPFDGVTGVHLLTIGGDDYATLTTGPELVKRAQAAGVRRVAVLWNGDIGPVEEAVAASSLEWTRLQPTDFMGNTLHLAPSIRAEGLVRELFADVPAAPVHEADVGEVSAAVLTQAGHAGKAYTLTGGKALSARQRVARLGAVLGRELTFVELTEAQARARWRDQGLADEMIDTLVAWQGSPPPHAYTVTDTVATILGRPPRTFDEWASENALRFS